MNPYSERYKKLGNSALLKIIDIPGDYQPGAIEAAKEELASRRLTDDELTVLHKEIAAQKHEQQLKVEKVNAIKDKAKDALHAVSEAVHPIRSEKLTLPKAVKWICILMALLFLYQLYAQYGLLMYMLANDTGSLGFSMLMYFLRPLLIMPVGGILFALHKKSGWVLLAGYFNYMAINTAALLYYSYTRPPDAGTRMALLLPSPPVNSLVSWIIFIGGCLYFILKKDVREYYSIKRQNIVTSVVIGIVLSATAIL